MMMLKPLHKRSDYQELAGLYQEAFPAPERAPYRLLKRRALQKKADYLGLTEDGKTVGMAYVLTHKDLAYLFYFAIDKRLRGRQYGRKAMELLLEKYNGKRFFLALEDWQESCDNKDQRIRRHAFYERCGLHDLPYKIREMSVTYAIMGNGDAIEPYEYKELIDVYTGPLLKHFLKMSIIKNN